MSSDNIWLDPLYLDDLLSEEEKEALDLSQESIHFFLEQDELQRLNYEYGIMYNMLKKGEF